MKKQTIIKATTYASAKKLFRAIDNKVRLNILRLLEDKALSVKEISEKLNIMGVVCSTHLAILKRHGIVVCENGALDLRNRVYGLNKDKIVLVNSVCEKVLK